MKNLLRYRILLTFLALPLLAGCGGNGLEEASEELARVENEVLRAQDARDDAKQQAEEAEETLAQAQRDLQEAKQALAAAKQSVANKASDTVLFREVQGRLLDDDALEGLAISARVKQRIVTLEGNAPSPAIKSRAEAIAKEIAGVETVVNQIDIDVAAAPE